MDSMYILYLLNDNIHTFGEVNSMLKRTFAYPTLQSDSIIEITDRVGRCVIKSSDDFDDLKRIEELLLNEGFKVEIKTL